MAWQATPESSNIVGFDYDERTHILTVEFKSGGKYNYFDVPQNIYEQMTRAPSKGQFLSREIKSRFRYARV